jgi:PAS domain S-box-containing protein
MRRKSGTPSSPSGNSRAEDLRSKELERTGALLELYMKAPQLTDQQICECALEEAVKLTDSEIGYLHELSVDQTMLTLSTWNKEARKQCAVTYTDHYPLSEAGIWADCVRLRRPVLHNDYPALAHKKDLPDGHVQVSRHLSLPVVENDRIKFVLGVGNKQAAYNGDDIIQLEQIAGELHKIMVRRRAEQALQASETRYRVVADNTYDWEFWLDPEGRFIYSSPSCERITGYRAAEFEADPDLLVRLIHPDDRPRFEAHQRKVRVDQVMAEEEFRIVRADRAVGWIGQLCGPVFDEAGRFLGVRGSNRDISERKLAEETLRRSEERYGTLVRSSPYCIHEIDRQGRLASMNPAGLAMMGVREESAIVGMPYLDAVADEDRGRIGQLLQAALEGQWSEFEFRARNGRYFASSFVPIRDVGGAVLRVMGLTQDITARTKAEASLLDYQQRLRSLTSELSRVEQRERRRVAGLLHDDVIQALALSRIRLSELRQSLGVAEQQGLLDRTRELVEGAIQGTRSLMSQLSPPILHELGLEPALDWLTEQIAGREGLAWQFASDGRPKLLDDDGKVLLFTAVRELLLNVVKHARAGHVTVRSSRENGTIQISVEDDGVGFDTRLRSRCCGESGGFGLFSIRERLGYLGGYCEIHSEPGKGTRAVLALPLKQDGAHEDSHHTGG